VGDLVAIGHGVQTGPGCLIVAQAGIAGSTTLGRYCVLAGQVGISGHLKIGDQVTIAAQSGVASDIPAGEKVFGYPAFEMGKALRAYQLIKSLPEFRTDLMQLEKRLGVLEAASRPKTKPAR
ncbi:MAG TPA: UDP-3-O-(3-hydroxymyristoyl)glucosamine N-acyltransferase, partial [Verrucomicrobiae bacterium]|nr:UDP-3-O-(3-hydroxymyristoyl)glucosamine N-acyltransferase [Verrucomicrobiae bacterium]